MILSKDAANPHESRMAEALTGDPALRDGDLYREKILPWTMSLLFTQAEMLTDAGIPVILDAPFLAQMSDCLHLPDTPFLDLFPDTIRERVTDLRWLEVDSATQRRRMISRAALRDQPKLSDWETYEESLQFLRSNSEEIAQRIALG